MNWNIPTTSGKQPLQITLEAGDRLFMVGANGSGKSALIQHLVSSLRNKKFKRLSAHSTDMAYLGKHRHHSAGPHTT